ncbi:PadR family transcriptional regulator [Psychrobacillus sp. NEAU-3TGS]|uniref:PadR family transcriptional regulator n=1 Tax=Psychrobacillus sp. NEAU-3TGS TaxID=2995412 RepID=UPI0024971ECC|nr:PadR family transcriptional regulator [Psychrobacillus sp. NEAU-3TGS]MDI2587951.1 PadR family transcriptional regulator [Psychrobacillus sp. NEAU-3TGS]
MEERLKKLKKSMDQTTFSELTFDEQHRKAIQEKIMKEENEDTIFIAVMQLLVQEKTGYELVKLLRGRGIRKFEENEGILYTFLHQLEQEGYLNTRWNDSNIKHYRLNNKGTKLLRKSEKQSIPKPFAFKELVER